MKKVLLVLLSCCWGLCLSAQNENERQICDQAEQYYQLGRLDEAVTFLEGNVKNLSTLPKITALKLLALCYLEQDKTELAEKNVSLLLKEDPYYNITLNDPPRFVDMITKLKRGESATITTASQQAESLSEVPVPVTLITEEMIKQSGARTLSDLLTLYVPGMSFVEGIEENMAMHGVYSTLQEKILVMQDGHRLNSRTNNSEAFDYRTSLEKIKQIEVLRGPASSLYGNVALTAVVNIITKKGHDVDGVECTLGGGNNNSYRADLLMGKKIMGLDFSAWGSVYTSEGEIRNVGLSDEEYYGKIVCPKKMYIDGYNHHPAYDLGFSAQWKNLNFTFSMQNAKRVPSYIAFLFAGVYDYDKYRKYDGVKPGHSRKSTRFDMSYNKTINNHWSYKVSAFLDIEDCKNYDVVGDSLPPESRFIPNNPSSGEIFQPGPVKDMNDYGVYQVQTWNDYSYGVTAQTNYQFNFGKWKNSLLSGVQFENYTLQDSKLLLGDHYQRVIMTYSVDNRSIDFGHELNISPFIQLKSKFSDHFIFNGGLRLDSKRRYNDKWLTVLSPRLSLIYNVKPALNFKLSYAHSFVDAPFFYRASKILTYPGGKDLDPESNDAIQFTVEGAFINNRLKYQSNVFFNRLSDLIYHDIGHFSYNKAGTLDLFGFEQVLSGKIHRSSAYLNFTYQRVLNTTNYIASGSSIHNVPNFMLNAMYDYQLMKNKKYGALDAKVIVNVLSKQKSPITCPVVFIGDVPAINRSYELPARATLNLGLDYNFNNISLSVNAYNILNKKYYQGGDFPMPIPQKGFNWMTKISYKF